VKKTKLANPYALSIEQAIMAEHDAKSTLRKSKLLAIKWHTEHNRRLESALAKAKGTTHQHK
jgi:hypothetical protein